MKKKQKLQRMGLVLSGMAFWGLMMPATILGLVVSIAFFLLMLNVSKTLIQKKEKMGRQMYIAYVVTGILYIILLYDFEQRWVLSSKVNAVTSKIGMPVNAFVFLTACFLVIFSLYFVRSVLYALFCEDAGTILEPVSNEIIRLSVQDVIVCICIAVIFGFELAANPWSNGYPGTDSAVFLYIGERMREGLVPYVDLFDHKGIILYFIEYAGMTIGNGRFGGVWLFEIVGLFLTAVFTLKIALLFNRSKNTAYATAFITLLVFSGYLSIEGGNVVEEYALPWITIALYICVKFFVKDTYKRQDIVWLGISFAVVFFLRQNMITVWIAFLPVIFFYLLYKKRFSELGECISFFVMGCLVVCIPLLIYFWKNNNLQQMLECYFLFNFGYSDGESGLAGILKCAGYLLLQAPLGIIALLISMKKCIKKPVWILNLLFCVVSILLASMSGRSYQHYGIMLIPSLIIPIAAMTDWIQKEWIQTLKGRQVPLFVGMFTAAIFVMALNIWKYSPADMTEAAVFLKENTAEKDNVLVLGNNCRYYLESGRSTDNRFFYQTPPIDVSEELYEEFMKEFDSHEPDCVVITGKKENLESGNYGKLLRKLADMEQRGVYSETEYDSFYAYIKN